MNVWGNSFLKMVQHHQVFFLLVMIPRTLEFFFASALNPAACFMGSFTRAFCVLWKHQPSHLVVHIVLELRWKKALPVLQCLASPTQTSGLTNPKYVPQSKITMLSNTTNNTSQQSFGRTFVVSKQTNIT